MQNAPIEGNKVTKYLIQQPLVLPVGVHDLFMCNSSLPFILSFASSVLYSISIGSFLEPVQMYSVALRDSKWRPWSPGSTAPKEFHPYQNPDKSFRDERKTSMNSNNPPTVHPHWEWANFTLSEYSTGKSPKAVAETKYWMSLWNMRAWFGLPKLW